MGCIQTLEKCTIENTQTLSFGNKEFQAKVLSIKDGDTIVVALKFLNSFINVPVRLLGVDVAEIHTKNYKEKKVGLDAQAFLTELLLNKIVYIKTPPEDDKYGRLLGRVFYQGQNISELMIQKNYGYPYHGEKKKLFSEWYKGEEVKEPFWDCCDHISMPISMKCKTCGKWHCYCNPEKYTVVHFRSTVSCKKCGHNNPDC
jgi:endonuclease YncB( thermonuclease family)